MVRQQLITDSQKLRLQAVHCKQHNQSWSASKIGKHIGCSSKFVNRWVERHQQSGTINDKHRSGRPQKADDAAEQYICMAAKLPECTSAADIAAKTQQANGPKIEHKQRETSSQKEGAAALDSKVSANADTSAEAGQSQICQVSPQERALLVAQSPDH